MASPRLSAFRADHLWREACEPTFWLDKALRIVWVNAAWEALTGYPAESILGVTSRSHSPTQPGDRTELAASFYPPPQAIAGQPARRQTLILHAQGEKLWRELDFWPFRDNRGELIGFLGRIREPGSSGVFLDAAEPSLHEELLEVRRRLGRKHGIDDLIGQGEAHSRLLEQIRLAGNSMAPALIVGEPGTGRRTVAGTIHQLSQNSAQPITYIDCEALSAELLEKQLLELRSSAIVPRFERSPSEPDGFLTHSQGRRTIVIGDILALPRDLQVKLVEMLGQEPRPRVLALTPGDPEAALRSEQLRSDLYYALTPLILRLPPLRERRSEILLLAQYFLERTNRQAEIQKQGFSVTAQAILNAYDWPGNLRELDRVIWHARERSENPIVAGEDLPASIRGNLGSAYTPAPVPYLSKPLDELLTEIERQLIENALAKARSNKTRAAELLGISRPRLYRRMKELNLDDEADAEDDAGPGAS
ncbi:MAG: hypothetical protein ABS87_08270 [Sphingomonas sp. SCN 67-18]|nr:sigma 54-interacting transcriptional regulator [Sphingomonas sp. SCN 67-18]ODU20945.1 MAG: hypothetical protein ABS87_08270 [Sphingomonas sp. SCN 67-18]